MIHRARFFALASLSALALMSSVDSAAAQSDILLQLRSGTTVSDRFRVDSAGGVVALGRLNYGIMPHSGEGIRMMWVPSRAAFRVGSNTEYESAYDMGTYSVAIGENVSVTGQSGAAFGVGNTVAGAAGFSAGSQNRCTGFACVSLGYVANANGEGAVAIGYRNTADANYSFALGRMASTNGFTGAFVWADASIADSVQATATNQFTVRARGGIRLRTSTATGDNVGINANTGCDIPGNSGTMSCASSRTLKEQFVDVNGEEVLSRIRQTPVTTWNYIGEDGKTKHMGPVAEDFYAAFGLGINNTTIGHLDIDGVNFAAVKALEIRTAELKEKQKQVDALQAEVAELRATQAELRAKQAEADRRLKRLEAAFER